MWALQGFSLSDNMRNWVVILFALSLACCSSSDDGQQRVLTVTTEPYRYVVEAVAGDAWRVNTLVPRGADPETFDPTVHDIMSLNGSSAYFMVGGLGFEDAWRGRIAEMFPALRIVDTSEGIVRDCGDPHLWCSPDNMLLIANNVCEALCRMDSVGAEAYRWRLDSLSARIIDTHLQIKTKLDTVAGCTFVVFHPSLTYFARLYGLRQLAIEEEGKEPSAAHIKGIIDRARKENVALVFVQQEFDSKNAITIAREIGARVVEIDPLSYDWHGELLNIADEMVKNR